MKMVVLDGYTLNPGDISWAPLEAFGTLTRYDRTPPEAIRERIGDAEIVLTNKTPITRETLAACPGIRLICVLATGYDGVDLAAAREKGIPVCNVPAYGTNAVAQFAMGLLLEVCHRIGHHHREVLEGRWSASPDVCFWDYPQIELEGKTIGIIGFGRIGQAMARLSLAFGMRVLAFDSSPVSAPDLPAERVSLEALLARADIVSLHCPLTPETQGIISREAIARMKDGVILLNNARGPLVDEEALAEALRSGKVYAAAVDVASREPILPDNPLLTAPNCIITPHISWATRAARQRLMGITADSIRGFLAGQPLHVVNP